jgi:hypothetical protein
LIPVSNTSAVVVSSEKAGDSLWIGFLVLVLGTGLSSIGSHKTLNILPKTSFHTGTEIGPSKEVTSVSLLSPSVVFIAIVLTIPSPNCCCTSSTTLFSAQVTSNAS